MNSTNFNEDGDREPKLGQGFTTTHWSVVIQAGHDASPNAETALERLCRTYWYPLYAYIRRQGYGPHDAEDLTQAFFARILEKGYIAQAQQEKGKFRSFLLGCLRHFLSDELDRAHAAKRGGGKKLISLDEVLANERYACEPAEQVTPEKLFERRWVLAVLEEARRRLREEYVRAGKAAQYEGLRVFEDTDGDTPSYAEVGNRLGITEAAVKGAVYRLRQRYHELVREEIAQTVANPAEVDNEIRYLVGVLGD